MKECRKSREKRWCALFGIAKYIKTAIPEQWLKKIPKPDYLATTCAESGWDARGQVIGLMLILVTK